MVWLIFILFLFACGLYCSYHSLYCLALTPPCLLHHPGPNVQNVATAVEQIYPLLFECQKPLVSRQQNWGGVPSVLQLVLGFYFFDFTTRWKRPHRWTGRHPDCLKTSPNVVVVDRIALSVSFLTSAGTDAPPTLTVGLEVVSSALGCFCMEMERPVFKRIWPFNCIVEESGLRSRIFITWRTSRSFCLEFLRSSSVHGLFVHT